MSSGIIYAYHSFCNFTCVDYRSYFAIVPGRLFLINLSPFLFAQQPYSKESSKRIIMTDSNGGMDSGTNVTEVPPASTVSVEEALLEDAAAAVRLLQESSVVPKPPSPLPMHWVLRESRSQPGYYYYFNHETGISSWQPPLVVATTNAAMSEDLVASSAPQYSLEELGNLSAAVVAAATTHVESKADTPATKPTDVSSGHKRPLPASAPTSSSNKRPSSKPKPSKVRIFHILKKHVESRNPTSWRLSQITATKDEATQELQGLLDVLREVQSDPAELRATMEELARTESDCSSYKRGGDLGFFGPKKMQPPFEEAAFALEINELSDIVETSSGVHILLRVG
jgi:peptidyl-prolyl cis-trans isomerase NIMA-interacting 1